MPRGFSPVEDSRHDPTITSDTVKILNLKRRGRCVLYSLGSKVSLLLIQTTNSHSHLFNDL
jgi:hypothetical protein